MPAVWVLCCGPGKLESWKVEKCELGSVIFLIKRLLAALDYSNLPARPALRPAGPAAVQASPKARFASLHRLIELWRVLL